MDCKCTRPKQHILAQEEEEEERKH